MPKKMSKRIDNPENLNITLPKDTVEKIDIFMINSYISSYGKAIEAIIDAFLDTQMGLKTLLDLHGKSEENPDYVIPQVRKTLFNIDARVFRLKRMENKKYMLNEYSDDPVSLSIILPKNTVTKLDKIKKSMYLSNRGIVVHLAIEALWDVQIDPLDIFKIQNPETHRDAVEKILSELSNMSQRIVVFGENHE